MCDSCDIQGHSRADPIFATCYSQDHSITNYIGEVKTEVGIENLITIVDEEFPGFSSHVIAELSVMAQLRIEDVDLPFTLVYLGEPSTGKTTILKMLTTTDQAYYTDDFTPRAFVSNSANHKKDELEKIDLLPRIKRKCVVIPDFASLLRRKSEDLLDLFGILTRVLDGQGYSTDTGAHGRRGYEGDYVFMMVAAAVDIKNHIWKLMGNLGHRIYFYRMPQDTRTNEEKQQSILKILGEDKSSKKLARCQKAVKAFWDSLPDNVKWNKAGDDEDTRKNIIQLAELLSFLRVEVPSWHDKDGTYLETPVKEDYLRASKHLYNLACGHSFIFGRTHVTKDDLSLVVKVALDSAPKERTNLFKALIKNNGFS